MSFNPRARVGRDDRLPVTVTLPCRVSIHAPAWGATQRGSHTQRAGNRFNPRARVGRDYDGSTPISH